MLKRVAVVCLLASAAQAEEIKEWETVFEQDSWRLDVNIWTDDSLSCETRSMDDNGTLFSVESWQDGSFTITVWNEEWQFPQEEVDQNFVIRIDDDAPWDIVGSKSFSSVYSYLDRSEPSTQRFLAAFYNGREMAVESTSGDTIARYHLSGTIATMEEHSKCEDRIGDASAALGDNPGAKLTKDTF
jgi:hypothetical protein